MLLFVLLLVRIVDICYVIVDCDENCINCIPTTEGCTECDGGFFLQRHTCLGIRLNTLDGETSFINHQIQWNT